jgi:hypothetical protein
MSTDSTAENELSRQVAGTAALVAPPAREIAPGLVMREMSASSMAICALVNNPVAGVLMGDGKLEDLGDQAVLEFLYIHCAPKDAVRRASVDRETFVRQALTWGEEVPAAILISVRAVLKEAATMIRALRFGVEPKPERSGGDSPPGNS